MKSTKLYLTIVTGICISLGSLGRADAQYSVQGDNISKVIESLELFHCGAPDELTNESGVAITVEIEKANGSRERGLQQRGNPNSTFDTLPANSNTAYEINSKVFRSSSSDSVKLVITIPAIKNSSGNWTIKQVKWNLGKDHEPTYTKLNYLGREKGYEVIFVYEKGVQPCLNPKQEHALSHVEGHICDPDTEVCG